jgi:hypothetical protein
MYQEMNTSSSSGSEAERADTGPRTDFEFIPVVGNNLRGDQTTRRRVRSHAQADYRRRNAPAPRRPLHVELDLAPLLSLPQQHTQQLPATEEPAATSEPSNQNDIIQSASIRPLSVRDVGRTDVFGLLPENQRRRARLLWDHCSL